MKLPCTKAQGSFFVQRGSLHIISNILYHNDMARAGGWLLKMSFRFTGKEGTFQKSEQVESEFLFLIQRSILFELKSEGFLSDIQYHQAELLLYQHYHKAFLLRVMKKTE